MATLEAGQDGETARKLRWKWGRNHCLVSRQGPREEKLQHEYQRCGSCSKEKGQDADEDQGLETSVGWQRAISREGWERGQGLEVARWE